MISKLKEVSNGYNIIGNHNSFGNELATRLNESLNESANYDKLQTPSEILFIIKKQKLSPDNQDEYFENIEKLLTMLNTLSYTDYPDNTMEVIDDIRPTVASVDNNFPSQDRIYKLIFDISNKFNRISDTQYLSQDEKQALNEEAMSISDLTQVEVMNIFNKLTKLESQSLAVDLFEINDFIRLILGNPSEFNTKLLNTLLRYLYGKFINNISILRRISDILNESLSSCNIQDFNMTINQEYVFDISSLLKLWIKKFNEASDNVKNLRNPEYDVATELGIDVILHDNNKCITEGAIKQTIKAGIRQVKKANKRISRGIDSRVQRIVDDYRESQTSRMEDKILKSTWKASSFLKALIAGGTLALIPEIGPALGLIFLITRFATNKHTELKVKQKLLNDLKEELTIVEEKIRDADRNDDTKAKYKLMRLANHLKRSIDKVQFNLREF